MKKIFLILFFAIFIVGTVSAAADQFDINWIIPDDNPPTFDNLRNFTIIVNSSFSESITASDDIGIDTYSLNDTSVFIINESTGLITNSVQLVNETIYWLNITVNDTSGNQISGIFFINVTVQVDTPRNLQRWKNIITGEDVATLNNSGDLWLKGNISATDAFITSLTEGSVLFSGVDGLVSENNGNFFWNNIENTLSIGTTISNLTIGGVEKGSKLYTESQGGGGAYDIIFERHSNTASSVLTGARSRGSHASPSIVQDGDNIFEIKGAAYDGTDWEFLAEIHFEIDGTPSNDNMPGMLRFLTTPNGSRIPIERMRIDNAGNMTIHNNLTVTDTIFASAINISNSSFSFSDNENESIRYSVENKNSGTNATALMTVLNDVGGIMKIGIGSSNYFLGSISRPNITALFSRSMGETLFANFFNKAFVWMINPSNDNDPNNLVEVMRLDENGLNISGNLFVNGTISGTESEKSWSISSVDGSGSHYIGGFYDLNSGNNDFNPSINFGGVNRASGDHIFVVCEAGASGGTDTIVRVTGTSIQDNSTRITSDTEDLIIDDAGSAGAYYETSKKFLGQVSIEKQSGPDIQCNYGSAKYWDNNNNNFTITGFEATWIGGANDNNPNMVLRHHKTLGWTYNAGSTPSPPNSVADMQTDYATEIQIDNGENGAWKRIDLNEFIDGSGSEGIIIELVTTVGSGKTFEIGNFIMRIRT